MNTVTMTGLGLSNSETLLVARSKDGRWYASVGNLNRSTQRELVTGDTADEALALLFMTLGAKVDGLN